MLFLKNGTTNINVFYLNEISYKCRGLNQVLQKIQHHRNRPNVRDRLPLVFRPALIVTHSIAVLAFGQDITDAKVRSTFTLTRVVCLLN